MIKCLPSTNETERSRKKQACPITFKTTMLNVKIINFFNRKYFKSNQNYFHLGNNFTQLPLSSMIRGEGSRMSCSVLRLCYRISEVAGLRPETRPLVSGSSPPSTTLQACHLHHCLCKICPVQNLLHISYVTLDNQFQSLHFFTCKSPLKGLACTP